MELNDNYVSSRKFKDDEDAIWLILDAAIKKVISLYLQSTGSHRLIILSSVQIQEIRSYYPQKVNLLAEEITDYTFPKGRIKEHYQLVSFSDLWITKTEVEKILEKQSNGLPIKSNQQNDIEKSTMLRLILGMAIASYKYNPGSDRNAATGSNKGSIKHDLEKFGLHISEDTVRKYLNEAVKEYPEVLKYANRMVS